MKRREFIALLGGAVAVSYPGAAHAQDRMRRVAVSRDTNAGDPDAEADNAAFEKTIQELGWAIGRNITIDYRWSGGNAERARVLASEALKTLPDVIVAIGTASVGALRAETRTVPIVFARVSDPVGQGFVTNLAKPGGNITGFSNFELSMGGKWVETLKEIAPSVSRVAVMANPNTSALDGYFNSIVAASASLGIKPIKAPIHDNLELERAMANVGERPDGGAIVLPDGFMISNRDAVIAQANKVLLPVLYPFRLFTDAGGLVSYGINTIEQFRGVASYVDRILKGERPGDLPVQGPTKFQLVINLKAAQAIGLNISPSVLVRADEVIELSVIKVFETASSANKGGSGSSV
jgi:putative tryptophan/tyrosine transport system substrate-binding protein